MRLRQVRSDSLEDSHGSNGRAGAGADLKRKSQKQEEIGQFSQVGEVLNNQQVFLEHHGVDGFGAQGFRRVRGERIDAEGRRLLWK